MSSKNINPQVIVKSKKNEKRKKKKIRPEQNNKNGDEFKGD